MDSKTPDLYYGDYYGKNKWVRRRFFLSYLILKPYLKKNAEILDIGCYKADFLDLIDVPVSYFGVDFDQKALEIARRKGVKTFFVDLETAKLPLKKKFDIVILTELLEHLKDPEGVLHQVSDLLKADGVVLISLPNECTIFHRIKVLLGKGIDSSGFAPFYHLHFPTLSQNEEFIGKYFTIVDKKYNVNLYLEGVLGNILSAVPLIFWEYLAAFFPTFFARGAIYLCKKPKTANEKTKVEK